ncbi:cellulase family glycosylhydrolase [Mongoliitalea daihaiensis]|nr:cellulase family glycosylhydrolase [Mongoliitalea daihaiensis]
MQTFGLGNPELMKDWNIKIVREFIGNLGEQPVDGYPIRGSDNKWYHPLQRIVEQNRSQNIITILCPFGWVNPTGEQILFAGLNPSEQNFYTAYKTKMREIAEHFKDQPDVWIQVWNEPYHWNNENGYTHEIWLRDMSEMVDNLRWVNGFHNLIIVPGNEMGQSENAILSHGKQLTDNRFNIVFDLHAYEKWLVNTSENQIKERLLGIKNKGIPFIFGEVGVQNVGAVMEVNHFLQAADSHEISVLAWLWVQNSQYKNALLDEGGEPNSTPSNNHWGEVFKNFLRE